jgi:GT2 family glycosyltransferase
MSQTTPQVADTEAIDETAHAPHVRVIITAVAGSDLEAALGVVERQVYEPAPDVVVVGDDIEPGIDVATASNLEEVIASTGPEIDYLWLLHADARPRPDALAALVSEIERNEASLAGSKLLKAGTMDELESVGGATDVFGEPYSGLDEGEIDLQQYDVVREVAFVQSASMLVRRDLAQGLRGLDPLLPPVAAGLDFSQRTRLAGGRVISVPSSEVYHQARCGHRGRGWREQAGRLRAMLIAYSPLTLLWVIPYDILVSIVDSIASLLLLRWKPVVRHLFSWGWNILHFPSTIRQRRRLRSVRSEGDEELFRFHAKGSVRLRAIGEEVSGRALSIFDDDQALARGSRRIWSSPGIWGAVVAIALALVGARSILLTGMPNTGFSFPFEAPSIALERWFAGWNDSGLGSSSPVHPSVGLAGLVSWLWFGAEGAARTLLTIGAAAMGIVGAGRLAGRIGLRGPGRYLAGLVLIAGPGTAALTDRGSWLALMAAAALPWAVRSTFVHPHEFGRSRLSNVGWALLMGVILAMASPLLAFAPLVTVLVWRALGGDRASLSLALASALGGVAGLAFVLGDPGWVIDTGRRLDLTVGELWPAAIALAALPLVFVAGRTRLTAITGALIALAALASGILVPLAPGAQEAVFVFSSLGAGLVTAAALDGLSRNPLKVVAALGGLAILLMSIGPLMNGRLGLSAGDANERLSFALTLLEEDGPGRMLYASSDSDVIPGEALAGPGYWYRVVDATGTTHDEIWLPEEEEGDLLLEDALIDISSGADLRPGMRLAEFAVDWVVLDGETFVLDDALLAQLDLVPTPLDPESRVYENRESQPLAGTAESPWAREGTGFAGDSVDGSVSLAINFASGWEPDGARDGWKVSVDGEQGAASYSPELMDLALPAATILLALAALALIAVGRFRT